MSVSQVHIPARVRPLLESIGQTAQRSGTVAYAVGGCVRDWLLGIVDTTDLDVTVEGGGIALAQEAAAAFDGRVTVHQQFGTATVAFESAAHRPMAAVKNLVRSDSSLRVDFATCRRETYVKPAAYPKVTAGTLEDDLFRRDFTVNAMAVSLSPEQFGTLIDPFGGAADLHRKALRILHERSFLDDPSRVLRGVRFTERFGFHWDARTAKALRAAVAAGALGWLNPGRLRKELNLMCEEPDPLTCFQHLARLLASTQSARARAVAASGGDG